MREDHGLGLHAPIRRIFTVLHACNLEKRRQSATFMMFWSDARYSSQRHADESALSLLAGAMGTMVQCLTFPSLLLSTSSTHTSKARKPFDLEPLWTLDFLTPKASKGKTFTSRYLQDF